MKYELRLACPVRNNGTYAHTKTLSKQIDTKVPVDTQVSTKLNNRYVDFKAGKFYRMFKQNLHISQVLTEQRMPNFVLFSHQNDKPNYLCIHSPQYSVRLDQVLLTFSPQFAIQTTSTFILLHSLVQLLQYLPLPTLIKLYADLFTT